MPLIAEQRAALGPPVPLSDLGRALREEGIACCQWKGHEKPERWATGLGDVDLLVDRVDATRFNVIARRLGFKEALPPRARVIPGLAELLCPDPATGALLRLHVHCRLVVGRYYTPRYRLPVERPLLLASVPALPFPIPPPEWTLLLLVLRTALDRRALRRGGVFAERAAEAEALEAMADWQRLTAALEQHLPALPRYRFELCLRALLDADPRRWAREAAAVRRCLGTFREPAPAAAIASAAAAYALSRARRAAPAIVAPPARPRGSKRLADGGAVVALVGGDGAGKSTAAAALEAWLAPQLLLRRIHAGRPPRSLLTLASGAALKVAKRLAGRRAERSRLVARARMLRSLCTARDRLRLCSAAARFAAGGGIVIAERWPLRHEASLAGPHIRALAGTRQPGPLVRLMILTEERCYDRIPPPDAVVLLRVTPEVAVARKSDEPADYVLARNLLVSRADWSTVGARIVDADRPLGDVLHSLLDAVWSAL